MIRKKIIEFLSKKLDSHFTLLIPKNPDHGDYAIHEKQVGSLSNQSLFEKVEKKGGFINFFINRQILIEEMNNVIQTKDTYGSADLLTKQKIMVEFAHPNTHKLFHIGHLRNIILGEAISRLLTLAGASVVRTNYQGDVGLHIAKCLWGMQNATPRLRSGSKLEFQNLDEKIHYLAQAYVEGNKAYATDERAKRAINQLNRLIFEKDQSTVNLWRETRQWSLEYFDSIYKRLEVKFDRLYFESQVADQGLQLAREALKKGILEVSEGAIIFNGKKYGLDTRVFVNSQGLPTYEAKELGLSQMEFSDFGQLDRCIHVVGSEQTSFFKTVFKVEELLDQKTYEDKQRHFVYGFVRLKAGKMSSREGNVVTADQLLTAVKDKIITTFKCDQTTAESLTLASVKYGFLKIDPKKDLSFDIDESISLQGNSGPYLLYAYARTQSIMSKSEIRTGPISSPSRAQSRDKPETNSKLKIDKEEQSLLRSFFRFPELVETAASQYAPHFLCAYAFDLAQKFNLFYEKLPILKAEARQRAERLRLTAATGQILKNALFLLGIKTVDKI